MDGRMKADLLPAQPVDQSRGVGHLAATGLGVVLQVLFLLHRSVIKSLKIKADQSVIGFLYMPNKTMILLFRSDTLIELWI